MSETALIHGRLIDGNGEEPLDDWGLVVRDSKILDVGATGALSIPKDAEVVDLKGRTVMPGIIDSHTHLCYHRSYKGLFPPQDRESLEANTVKGVDNAAMILATGCTAIADGGTRGRVNIAIRDAVNQGLIPGPKVVASGQIISGSSGLGDHTALWGYIESDVFIGTTANGPEEFRTAVRKQVRQGVDFIKVAVSGLSPGIPDSRTQVLSLEEMTAAVQEAAKFGKWVHAHAHDAEGIKDAARAGITSLHSGQYMDDEGLQLMKETGCIFVPTVAWLRFRTDEEYAKAFSGTSDPSFFIQEVGESYEVCEKAIVKAHKQGVPMAIGSDAAHVFPPYDIVCEMEYFQDLGIPPLEIITMGTKMSAKAIGCGDVWGTLEPNKAADILVVEGDPSENVSVLRDKSHIVMMFKDGQVVKDIMVKESVQVEVG